MASGSTQASRPGARCEKQGKVAPLDLDSRFETSLELLITATLELVITVIAAQSIHAL